MVGASIYDALALGLRSVPPWRLSRIHRSQSLDSHRRGGSVLAHLAIRPGLRISLRPLISSGRRVLRHRRRQPIRPLRRCPVELPRRPFLRNDASWLSIASLSSPHVVRRRDGHSAKHAATQGRSCRSVPAVTTAPVGRLFDNGSSHIIRLRRKPLCGASHIPFAMRSDALCAALVRCRLHDDGSAVSSHQHAKGCQQFAPPSPSRRGSE